MSNETLAVAISASIPLASLVSGTVTNGGIVWSGTTWVNSNNVNSPTYVNAGTYVSAGTSVSSGTYVSAGTYISSGTNYWLGSSPFIGQSTYNLMLGIGAMNNLSGSLTGNNNVGVGPSANSAITSGNYNNAFGVGALNGNTVTSQNSAMGHNALYSYTDTTVGNGKHTAVGYDCLYSLQTGYSNTAVGNGAGYSLIGGNSNALFGYNAGHNYNGTETGNILIGANVVGVASENNIIRIGVQGTQTACVIAGISGETSATGVAVLVNSSGVLGTTTSSAKYKDNIVSMTDDITSKTLSLNPVTFTYKNDNTKQKQYGLIAEEVETILPDLVMYKENDTGLKVPETFYYQFLAPLLLAAVKQVKKEKDSEISDLTSKLTDLNTRLSKLEGQ